MKAADDSARFATSPTPVRKRHRLAHPSQHSRHGRRFRPTGVINIDIVLQSLGAGTAGLADHPSRNGENLTSVRPRPDRRAASNRPSGLVGTITAAAFAVSDRRRHGLRPNSLLGGRYSCI